MPGRQKSMGAMAVAVGAVVLLTGCNDSSTGSQSTASSTKAAAATAAATTTSTGGANTSAGGESPSTGGGNSNAGGGSSNSGGGNSNAGGGSSNSGGGNSNAGGGASNSGGGNTSADSESPDTTGRGTRGELLDPCGISDADITKQGFRADSKEATTGPGTDKNCRWQSVGGNSELTIVSTRKMVEDFQQTGRYRDFSQVQVGGRAANQYRAAQDTNNIGCYVNIAVPSGSVIFVTRNLKPGAPEEPCAGARRISGALVGYLPPR
ncbi:DUF3558 domain-containing protein [Nocardia sp. NPDC004604]|uniref:DUF3558 domain-containing protein n=1 Tax=Nocardia sp. NPDC004604 TaxID=3157013 RepID=UPI0033AA28B7